MPQHRQTTVALPASAAWSAWGHEPADAPAEVPALLANQLFWLAGGASVVLWGCATALALHFA